MATLTISLPDSMQAFVEAEVAGGSYNTLSEYFRTLVREAQKRKEETRLAALLLEGRQSGDATLMTEEDWDDILDQLRLLAHNRIDRSSDVGIVTT